MAGGVIVLRDLVGVGVAEVELVEVGRGSVFVEVDGGLVAVVVDEGVAVERGERWGELVWPCVAA